MGPLLKPQAYRYALALVVLAALAIAANLVVQAEMESQTRVAETINVAGRQRMLSQRAPRLLLERLQSADPGVQDARQADLLATLDRMEAEHLWLLDQPAPPDLQARYDGAAGLDAEVGGFLADLRALTLAPVDQAVRDPRLATVLTHSRQDLLASLNDAVLHREHLAERGVSRMRRLESLVLVLQLLGLAAVGTLLVLPTMRSLSASLARIRSREQDMALILAHSSDGFVLVLPDGSIQQLSAAATAWFDAPDPGRPIWEVLEDTPSRQTLFELGWEQLGLGMLPSDVALAQLPATLERRGRTLAVAYTLVGKGSDGGFSHVLLHVTDITRQLALERLERRNRDLLAFVRALVQDRPSATAFFQETENTLKELADSDDRVVVKRLLHTVKGNAAIQGLDGLTRVAHDLEDRLIEDEEIDPGLLLHQLQTFWTGLASDIRLLVHLPRAGVTVPEEAHAQLVATLREAGHDELAAQVLTWNRPPLQPRLERLARQATRLAGTLDKSLRTTVEANGIRLDAPQLEPLWTACVHLVRNAVDHGIEAPDIRRASGKLPHGHLKLTAEQRPDGLLLVFQDDGKGIDWTRIRERARQAGLPCETDDELLEALCGDGFSTRTQVTEVSGRGIGMAAVRSAVEELGGELGVRSTFGKGTTWTVHLPPEAFDREEGGPRHRLMRDRSEHAVAPAHHRLRRAPHPGVHVGRGGAGLDRLPRTAPSGSAPRGRPPLPHAARTSDGGRPPDPPRPLRPGPG